MKVRLRAIPHVARDFDAKPTAMVVEYEGSLSTIQIPPAGVSLLLGKNGTGKSSLLRALSLFTKDVESDRRTYKDLRTFPIVSLRFELPTEDEYLAYLQFVDDFKQGTRYEELLSREAESVVLLDKTHVHEGLFSLPLLEALNFALEDDFTAFEFQIRSRVLNAVETLSEFGLPDYEVQSFKKRQENLKSRSRNHYPQDWEEPSDYRERFCEFLLHQLWQSSVHCSGEQEPWWGFFENVSDPWVDSQEKKELFVVALRNVFERGSLHVTRWRYDRPPEISFLAPTDASEDIRRFFNERASANEVVVEGVTTFDVADGEFETGDIGPEEAEELGLEARPAFPQDILQIRGSGYCHSADFSPRRSIDEWVSLTRRFISCIQIPGAVTPNQVVEIAKSALRWMPQLTISDASDPESLDKYHLELEGIDDVKELLRDASSVLSQLDVGIAEVHGSIGDSPYLFSRLAGEPRRSPFVDSQTALTLSFTDGTQGQRRPLEHASDGQLSAIFGVLSVLGSRFSNNQSHQRSAVTIVLADEFDRHLHPSTADKLLSVLHRRGQEAGISLLVSTHSVPLLESPGLRSSRRLYAERDALGRISIGAKPPQSLGSFAGLLGTSVLQARSLRGLHVVVEGNTDELVLREIFDDPRLPDGEFEFHVMDGMRQLKSLWRSSLSYLTSPILVVYDNRSAEFEAVWHEEVRVSPKPWGDQRALRSLEHQLSSRRQNQKTWGSAKRDVKELIEATIKLNPKAWGSVVSRQPDAHNEFLSMVLSSGSKALQRDRVAGLLRAKADLWQSGDEELASLLAIAKEVLDPSRHDDYMSQARRMHFFGLDEVDIVDYLPVKYFVAETSNEKGVPAKSKSWADARELVAPRSNADFKLSCGITEARVREVLQQMRLDDRLPISKRLNELRATAIGLLESP